MKARTETLTVAALAVLFTLPLAGCAEDGPGSMTEADEPIPGDPAIYAPDGWPLQIGDTLAPGQELQLQRDFLRYGGITGMHLVGDQVYGAEYRTEPTPFLIDGRLSVRIYEGHFAKAARTLPKNEHRLPPEFHGKIEYYPPPITIWHTDSEGRRHFRGFKFGPGHEEMVRRYEEMKHR